MPIVSLPGTQFGYGQQPVFGGCINTYVDTSSCVIIKSSTDFNFTTTTPFTIEFFVYRFLGNTEPYFFERASAFGLFLTGTTLKFFVGTSFETLGTLTNDESFNKWTHIAMTRDSSSDVRVFINGLQRGSTYNKSIAVTNTSNLVIGCRSSRVASSSSRSCFTNFRLIMGTCLYSSDFTPPRTPLTDITNTKLLLLSSTENTVFDNSSATTQELLITPNCIWNSLTPFS